MGATPATPGQCHTHPHSQVPRTKGKALSLQTLTHFSINSFPNASHAWNKPLMTGPPPDLPSLALLIRPPAPALLSRDAPRAAHRHGVSKQPGIPGLAPAGGKPLPAERTHPNSGANTAAFLAGWRGVAFSQRPGQGHAVRAGRQPAGRFSWGFFPTPAASRRNCFNYRGGSFRYTVPQLRAVLHCPSLRAPNRATQPAERDKLIITEKGN